MNTKLRKTSIIVIFLALFMNNAIYAHCEIPCGIYDDSLRIELIKEHIGTI